MRVADYIISFVQEKLNVDKIFLISGGGIMHMMDAIACNDKVGYVCSHNEQATTMEADGFAKTTGGFGVALVTTGPGATNAVTGVVGSWQDSSKLLVLSGQSKRSQTIHGSKLDSLRQFGAQEANILPIVKSVTKYSAMLDDPEKVRYHLEKAIFIAGNGRPGPVWLDIPLDVQGALIDPEKLEGFDPERENITTVNSNIHDGVEIRQLAQEIKDAKRPIIVAGQGVKLAGAVSELNSLIEKINIPIVTPRLGIDLIDSSHPLFVGRPGIKGDRAANFAIQNADLIITVGTRLSINVVGYEYEKFAREAKVVVVDIDKVEHKKPTIKIDKLINCDALQFIKVLSDKCSELNVRKSEDWPEKCRHWKTTYPVVLPEYKDASPINTYYLTDRLAALLTKDDIIIIDSGSSSYIVSQSIKIKEGQRYLSSGGLGSMGYALPAAIGASIARGRGRVICITGDGSLMMNMQELMTVKHENLPIKIIIFNNHGYSSIKATQRNYFSERFVGVDEKSGVSLPDMIKTANLFGIKGIKIENSDEIEGKLKEALDFDGPVLCDVICSPDQAVIPTVYSIKKDDGTMVSRPLEDMYPFLEREKFFEEMIIKPLKD